MPHDDRGPVWLSQDEALTWLVEGFTILPDDESAAGGTMNASPSRTPTWPGEDGTMGFVSTHPDTAARLLRRGRLLEWTTLLWNVVAVVILTALAVNASSVALAGFGLDSLIEIGASSVVLWELADTGEERQRKALRLIGIAFVALGVYLLIQSTIALVTAHHAETSIGGIIWTTITALVMFALAAGKRRTGRALGNPVLETEGQVTFIDGLLAVAVLLGISLNALAGWWWADPIAGYVIVFYAFREAVHIFRPEKP